MRRVLPTVLVLLAAATAIAQTRALIPGGSRSHSGIVTLSGGFDPDPHELDVRSGGNLDVRSMGLGPECRGFATDRPDVILRYSAPAEHLAFYARALSGDITMIVHGPDGRWRCDDDGAGGTNPRIDVEAPPAGQYDIWIGSFRADQSLPATLQISEAR
ncbi:MAG: hypothetical protein KC619_25675 [Myxococcales bacterium]|nr:hypothetical protein [Myxococcales bacterium]